MTSKTPDDEEITFLRNFGVLKSPTIAADAINAQVHENIPNAIVPPAVLVLGGTCFMGKELVQLLVARNARVCVCNRGRTYWGNTNAFDKNVAHIITDRHGDTNEFAHCIDVATCRLGTSWDLVADFSALTGAHMRGSLTGLRGRFHLYVYISSDSIYEVSAWAAESWKPRPEDRSCVSESHAARPLDSSEQERLCSLDRYGHEKLCAEEALLLGISKSTPKSRGLILRLPDVIGPFDRTLRLWAYWHWLRVANDEPVQVPSAPLQDADAESVPRDPRLALVYSRDVADFIVGLLQFRFSTGHPQCDTINIACSEQVPLADILKLFAEASGQVPLNLAYVTQPWSFLPSVKRPWPLCCERASYVYGFVPTPLPEIMRRCAAWFEEASVRYPQESQRAASKLPHNARQIALMLARLEGQSH